MVRGSDGIDRLTPEGVEICGDFELEWSVVCPFGAATGNKSLHLMLFDTSDVEVCDLYYAADALNEIQWHDSSGVVDTADADESSYLNIGMKLIRTSGVITAWYNINWTGWVQLTGTIAFADCFYIKADGATDLGLAELRFQADSGFPYPIPDPSDAKCIRTLLKFDDMLIMLSSPAVNNGIFGFRDGQELKSTDDFIEFQ